MKKIDKWKVSFISLTAVILALIIIVTIRTFSYIDIEYQNTTPINDTTTPTFQLKLDKKQTNHLVNFYLDEFQKDSKIRYKFLLENYALLEGDFKFLGQNLKLYLNFQPFVLENGNVELKIESISIGTLTVPKVEVLKYVKREYKLPEWVEINTNDENVIVHLDKYKLENGVYFSVDKIDLINDDIELNVFLPLE